MCLLLGSGISLHAEMPDTRTLSDQILIGKNVVRHTDGTYFVADQDHPVMHLRGFDPAAAINNVLLLLSQIKAEADVHYRGGSQSNYEDWFYLAEQLASDDFDNPAIWAFREHLRPRLEYEFAYGASSERLNQRADELCKYIRTMVIHHLSKPIGEIKLHWILDAVRDESMPCHGLFTLNHDRVLETLFEANQVSYTVGFERELEPGKPLHWDSAALSTPNGKVVLAKLHGSIDWRQQNNTREFLRDKDRCLRAFRRRDHDQTPDCEPMLLIGRHNKLYHYTNFLFEDLHYRFYLSLKASNVLIICGYGFGDKGINTRIINWKYSNPANTILVIRQDQAIDQSARGAIRNNFHDWNTNPTLLHLGVGAEKVTWVQIREALVAARRGNVA
jgi:hypothetical protein